MDDITKKRVIDWDNQLRKERDLCQNLGNSWSLSQVKELTGSYRRLTEKDKEKIGKGVLEPCEEFYLSLNALSRNAYNEICKNRSSAHFSKTSSKSSNSKFDEWDEKLRSFKENNGWSEFES